MQQKRMKNYVETTFRVLKPLCLIKKGIKTDFLELLHEKQSNKYYVLDHQLRFPRFTSAFWRLLANIKHILQFWQVSERFRILLV
jgi:hypothetical protein